ncbi:cytochrome P450 [Pyxidicoccus fallax]|nr:cytochrome P450 [Pyxidicoccus fallax]
MARPHHPPGPSMASLIWHMVTSGGDLDSFLWRSFQRYGDVVLLPFPGRPHYLLSNPDVIKHVLVDQGVTNYPKPAAPRGALFGEALTTSSGATWKRLRRMTQPAFLRGRLLSQVPRMVETLQRVLDQRWEPYLRSGAPMDVVREMSWVLISVMGQLVFSEEPPEDIREAVWDLTASSIAPRPLLAHLPFVPPSLMRWDHRRRHPRARSAVLRVNDFAWETVRRRMAQPAQQEDMLGVLIDERDDKGERLNERELHDEFVDLFVAGHSSAGIGIAWMWYCLAQHPEIASRTAATVERVLGGRTPTAEDLPGLQYVSQVFSETMRVHSVATDISRVAIKEDSIGGFDIPVGTSVTISPALMHRLPKYWRNPDAFDPEHFSDEQVQARPRFVYMAFSAGQRVCIGAMLASTIATLFAALVLQRYRLELVPGKKVVPSTGGTHYPKNLWMRVLAKPAASTP